ncbi:MAG TPA: MOSC domain-containing protein [Gaiellaceae bacterium]|nr:MOSC domain-containing protein [Gaiellaceae bacterium]
MEGRVAALWRYPVKSLAGERLDELDLDARGVVADRLWGLVRADGKIASGKHTRRFRRVDGLLRHAARLGPDGEPVLELADGRVLAPNDALAEELAGPGWRFAREAAISHFDIGAVHLVTTGSLASLEAFAGEPVEQERLRPNLVLDAGDVREEAWAGRRLVVGGVELEVTVPAQRCVMVGHAQRDLPKRRLLLKRIAEWNGVCAGMYASVVRSGRVRVGDAVELAR